MPSFLKSVLKSGFGVLISRVFGLVRDVVIAATFGATMLTDAFFVAFAIPNLFRALFAEGALSSAFVPILSDKLGSDKKIAHRYLSDLLTVLAILTSLIVILIICFAGVVVLLFMPGYADHSEITIIASQMLRILMPYLLLISLCGLFSGFLNLMGSYFIPYSSTAILNVAMIIGAVLGGYHDGDILYLAYSVIMGGIAQLFYIGFYAKIKGFRFVKGKGLDTDIKKTFQLILPAIAGVGINQLNFLMGRIVASFLGFGSISFLYYANRLFQFPLGMFSVTIGTVSLTELSKAHTNNDKALLSQILTHAFISILTIIIPATLGLYLLALEITSLVYERLSFDHQSAVSTAAALKMYAIGLLFFSLVNLFTKVFHAEKDTKTPVKIAFYSLMFNLIFTLLLIKPFGHAGIALASSLAALINAYLLFRKVNIQIDKTLFFRIGLKIIPAVLGMVICLSICKYFQLHVLVNILGCMVVYLGLLLLFKYNIRTLFK